MARPRVLRLPDGEVSLVGFSTERANELEALIKEGKKQAAPEVVPVVTPIQAPVAASPTPEYTEMAIGLTYNKERKMFILTHVKYCPLTGQGVVDKQNDAGEYRAFAINNFKVACVNLNFV